MAKQQSFFRNRFFITLYRWVSQILNPFYLIGGLKNYPWFLRDWIKYYRIKGGESMRLIDSYPIVHDKTKSTKFDHHYFYQDIWAAKHVYASRVAKHVDVGSLISFVGGLTAFTKVKFVDIRPLEVKIDGLECLEGDILAMPFADNSVKSLSCLHVAEHIGLGRYGDKLDPYGTKKAAKELQRILAPGGRLYFSLPIGRSRVAFNAHRVHSPDQILEYFDNLQLIELSGVNDNGEYKENIDINELRSCEYGCGFFIFKK